MPQFSFPRVLALGAVVALVGAGVATAVVVGVNAQNECVYPVGPGKASALVSVADSAEGLPVASFPTPLITTGRELTILEVGEGEGAKPGGYVDFDVSVFAVPMRNISLRLAIRNLPLFDEHSRSIAKSSLEHFWSVKGPAREL